MPFFTYRGRDQNGRLKKGTIEAASEDVVLTQLSRDGIIPVQIERTKRDLSAQDSIAVTFGVGKVQSDDLILFSKQMQTLAKAGVPLIRAMQVIRDACRSEKLKKAIIVIISSLESGQNLAISMQSHPSVFSDFLVAMVNVGENTGNLDEAFDQICHFLEAEQETKRRIKAATRYPIIVLIVISVAIGVINLLVVPAFKNFFTQFGSELPLPTRILIAMSDTMINYWPFILVAIIAGIISLLMYVHSEDGERAWDQYKLKIPLIGDILNLALLARFCRTFAMSLKAGVPLLQALTVVAQALDNKYMSEKVMLMRGGLERGEPLTSTAVNTKLFTPMVLQMLAIGEETGDVDGMLKQVADTYENDVDYELKRLSSAIEPILIVVIACMVLVLALGVFLPMWEMSSVAMRKGG
jgi:MSHA biogenesis protein MshG